MGISIILNSRVLVDVAMGRMPADLVIKNGQWVCVQSGEIIPKTDIAIKNGRIAFVGANADHTIGTGTQIIEATEKFLVPGLLDGHVHVESSMLTVTEFVRAVIPHGTTGIFIDPHEIANVFGLRGVRLMVDEAYAQPIHVWVQMPSCVPSAPGFETPGSSIGPKEVAEAMTWEGIIGLGEMMNFPGVFNGDEKMHAEMAETRRVGKVIGGHYASPDLGNPFHGYVVGGPEDDHEGTNLIDAITRARQGMKVMLRYGSGWHDVAAQVPAIVKEKLDSRHFLLVTDDAHSETLVDEGHMDRVLRHAISVGLPPVTAIQMATINTAEHFGLSRDIGQIAPGRFADILIVNDLEQLDMLVVIAKGRVLINEGKMQVDLPYYSYPDWVMNSIHLGHTLSPQDFRLTLAASNLPSNIDKVKAHVIGVIENQAPTKHMQVEMPVTNGEVRVDIIRDLVKIALVERHSATGRVQVGLVNGFGFNAPCAIASSVAHDSHHIIVIGTDESDMALAVNELSHVGGGQIVVREGKVIGMVELSIAGLMSTNRADIVSRRAASVLEGFKACGCHLNNPNMQLSLLALVVIPELRISDLGLVDVSSFKMIKFLEP